MPSFFAPASAWLFLLTVPVVVFYFLKLKRPRLVVPSLVLWRKAINDSRVNSPFQRFQRNILLLLQLLLLILLVLAAMQPYIRAREERVSRLPIVIDASASMAALDKPGGVSRLDEAKSRVNKIIDGLLPDQEIALVSFARSARRLTGFTNNRAELRAALNALRPDDTTGDIEEALRVVQAMSQNTGFESAMLLSDGNFPPEVNLALPFKVDYQRLPAGGPNYGITALAARRAGPLAWDIFVQLEASQASSAATLELWQDNLKEPTGKEHVTLKPASPERLVFRVTADKPTSLELRLKPDEFDSLAADNTAWLELGPARTLLVYIPTSLPAVRHAIATVEGVRVLPDEGDKSPPSGDYDLLITDRPADLALRAPTVMTIGVVPDDLKTMLALDDKGSSVVDWQRSEPLLQHVELRDVIFTDRPRSGDNVRESDYEKLGYEVVAHAPMGPLVLKRRDAARLTYTLTVNPDRSTLPYRVGFPIMLSNLAREAMRRSGLSEKNAAQTGVLPELALPGAAPGANVKVAGPDGMNRTERTDARGRLTGVPAPRAGRYQLAPENGAGLTVGAAVLDSRETTLMSIDQLRLKEVAVAAAAAAPVDRSIWPTLATIALVVLLIEWCVYQHRPTGR